VKILYSTTKRKQKRQQLLSESSRAQERNRKGNREVKHTSRCADKTVSQITEGQDGILEDAQECCGEGDKTKEKEDDVARERESEGSDLHKSDK